MSEEVKTVEEAPPPPPMGIDDEPFAELEAIVGSEYITKSPTICQAYNGRGYGREAFWYQGMTTRPSCVCLPASTEEVARIVKLCNRYDIPYTAGSTYWAVAASCMFRGDIVMIDLKRLDTLEIDEKNMYVKVGPSIIYSQLQAELMKRDLYIYMPGGGGQPSVVSNQMFQGQGILNYRICPWPERRFNGANWVNPEGEVIRCGIFMDREDHAAYGQAPGPDLFGIFKGNTAWWGTMGTLTEIATKVYPFQPERMIPAGLGRDAALDLPPRVQYQNYTLTTEEALQGAMQELYREQICGALNRVPMFWRDIAKAGSRQEFWDLWSKVTEQDTANTHIIRVLFIGYTSQKQLDFEMKVAEDIIVKKYGGTARRTKQTDDGTFQYSIVTGMWKPTGFYASSCVGFESTRCTLTLNDQQVEALNKEPYNSVFFEQHKEHPWYAPFNLGRVMYSEFMAYLDCEKIDPANSKFDMNHVGGLLTFLHSEIPMRVIQNGYSNLFGNGHINSKTELGPASHNYQEWVWKWKAEFDPKDVCRKGLGDHMDVVIQSAPQVLTEEYKAVRDNIASRGWKDAEI